MATILKKLTVDAENLGIFQPILKAEIWNRRSYLVDTFVTIPDFHQKFTDIQNNELLINLLRNTYGSFYEIVLYGSANIELLRCFFIMPDSDSNLSDIRLLTAYPEASARATSFLMLSDTPDSYFQQGGKVVAVREDEKGLEFITCHCGGEPVPPVISCDGATDSTACIEFSDSGLFDVYINDMSTPYLTNATPQQIASLEHGSLQAIECLIPDFLGIKVLEKPDYQIVTKVFNTVFQVKSMRGLELYSLNLDPRIENYLDYQVNTDSVQSFKTTLNNYFNSFVKSPDDVGQFLIDVVEVDYSYPEIENKLIFKDYINNYHPAYVDQNPFDISIGSSISAKLKATGYILKFIEMPLGFEYVALAKVNTPYVNTENNIEYSLLNRMLYENIKYQPNGINTYNQNPQYNDVVQGFDLSKNNFYDVTDQLQINVEKNIAPSFNNSLYGLKILEDQVNVLRFKIPVGAKNVKFNHYISNEDIDTYNFNKAIYYYDSYSEDHILFMNSVFSSNNLGEIAALWINILDYGHSDNQLKYQVGLDGVDEYLYLVVPHNLTAITVKFENQI